MFSTDIPHRLKALREAAGLSIRAMAAELGKSSSGYAHYENPDRFKDQFLPMQLAHEIAKVMEAHGVAADQVMALAGTRSDAALETRRNIGFAEDAAQPWAPGPSEKDAVEAAVRALAPGASNPGTFRMSRAIPALGLLVGDILIVDRKRLPATGELALANAQGEDGHMVTVVGRYLPPLLLTPESLTNGRILDVTHGAVAVYHPILGSFRSHQQTTKTA